MTAKQLTGCFYYYKSWNKQHCNLHTMEVNEEHIILQVIASNYCDTKNKQRKYEGWNFNSGNYLFTTDTK